MSDKALCAIPLVAGVADLIDDYDLFLIDQYGVLHDGATPYPGAVHALEALKAAGKIVVLISNSGRRAQANERRLARIGFPGGGYDAFVSSGEVAWHFINDRNPPIAPSGPIRCHLINRRGERSAIDGLDLTLVDDPALADMILLTGSDGDVMPLDHYRALLAPAAERGVPCLCTNPDNVMILPQGNGFGAGRIAQAYEKMGGPVTWIGKPFPEIYRFAAAEVTRLGHAIPAKARIIGIGDSIEHDVAGARRAGLGAALVLAGIHADDSPASLAASMRTERAWPDVRLQHFTWRN